MSAVIFVKCVPFERKLGFDLGPLMLPHGVVRSRGNALLTSMNQYKLVWQSDLALNRPVFLSGRVKGHLGPAPVSGAPGGFQASGIFTH